MSHEGLLFAALMSERGIKVSTSDPAQLRQELYKLRRADPSFTDLSFIISPSSPSDELWLVKTRGEQSVEE